MKHEYEIAKVLNNFFTILEKKLFKTFAILYLHFLSCHFYVDVFLSLATDLPESKVLTVLQKYLLVTSFFSSKFSYCSLDFLSRDTNLLLCI